LLLDSLVFPIECGSGVNGANGPRIDGDAKLNFDLSTSSPTDMPEAAYEGTAPTMGHSLHKDKTAQKIISHVTEQEFNNSEKKTGKD
jgi:hypothetical protein